MGTSMCALITAALLMPVLMLKRGVGTLLGPVAFGFFAILISLHDAFTVVPMLAYNNR